ncbi:MAG: YeiH family protein [Gammaproteobacteria bacterium]|nr:YeiH family protein [Gammaproteobacteria bacterium]
MLGITIGNSVYPRLAHSASAGVDLSRGQRLRLGIVLYRFLVQFRDILGMGLADIAIAAVAVGSVFGLAVLATEPVVRGQAHRVSVAVATLPVFGILGMFICPLLFPYLGLSEHAFGLSAGATIHEVQVLAVTRAVSAHGDGRAGVEYPDRYDPTGRHRPLAAGHDAVCGAAAGCSRRGPRSAQPRTRSAAERPARSLVLA